MRQIIVGLEIDVSDTPYTWNVYTINKDGDLVDLFDEIHDSDKAHAFTEELSRKTGLPLRTRYTL
jgi:hypothetical protein